MLQVTYISTAARDMSEVAVNDILRASRRNNAAAGVTGLLLYDGCRFLQALEGDAEAVKRTYERIEADPRHKAIVLLSSNEVNVRAFASWAMAAEAAAGQAVESITTVVDVLTEQVSDRTIRATFRSFAKIRAAA